ncbi:helix-turn-helix transcriptional regulator [Vibrio aestuarianus]|nr:AlpA family phage regulatory protein [Vibrio aestuarianus]MDE1215686.1 AlpA family phage regulatory protein [Vibrio aestuarianus]MDE1226980.1 AlpA family phage regulatory protein [Vibrio aestuarianus]MDE1284160.1 AlpA family phage regulatory protein [Vibrio aestuarianus]MDH5893531.1 AlpA family phage regulatory protein [Vibrio aestuarianus]WDS55609.1 AlpA family phage regulatory protein [Vibrio aestuarianus]
MLNRNYKTIWKWVKIGIFPEPVRFQGRTIGWKRADIEKWLSENS